MWRIHVACLVCFLTSAVSQAKPPDLPVEQGVVCPEQLFDVLRSVIDEVQVILPGTQAPDRSEEARHIFEFGERCRRAGDAAKARTCYEEAHLLSPMSRHGRLAMQRLVELQQAGDGAEEEEELPRRLPTTAEPPLLKVNPSGFPEAAVR